MHNNRFIQHQPHARQKDKSSSLPSPRRGWRWASSLALTFFILHSSLFILTSCSETEEESEFANWKDKNEAYFKDVYTNAVSRQAAGDGSWMTLRTWSLGEDNADFHAEIDDHIVVHVLSSSTSTSPSPMYTDTTRVVYEGRLIPSPSYSSGYVFQKTFEGEYNPATAVAAKLGVQEVKDGFATALQHMKVGDRWQVYIPYKLGYEDKAEGSIPAYSTLIFDMTLVSYYHPGKKTSVTKAQRKTSKP